LVRELMSGGAYVWEGEGLCPFPDLAEVCARTSDFIRQ